MSEGLPIKLFVKNALKDIQDGVDKNFVVGNVNFEVSVTASSKKGGKVDVKVVEAGADVSSQTTQRITFNVLSKRALTQELKRVIQLIKKLAELDQENRGKGRKRRRT